MPCFRTGECLGFNTSWRCRCHHGRRTLRTFGGYEAQHRKCLEIMMPRLRHSPRSFQRLVMLAKHNTRIHCRFSLRTWNVIIMVLLMAEILPTTQFYHSLSQYFFRVYTYIITSLNNSDISVMVSVFVHQMSAPGSPGGDPLGPTNRQVRASGTHRHESWWQRLSHLLHLPEAKFAVPECQRGSCVT